MADRIPFRLLTKTHRTMAEVDEFNSLLRRLYRGEALSEEEKRRGTELWIKELANNPPPIASPENAA